MAKRLNEIPDEFRSGWDVNELLVLLDLVGCNGWWARAGLGGFGSRPLRQSSDRAGSLEALIPIGQLDA